MCEFKTVKSNTDLQTFFHEVNFFHDSMIRQCTTQSIGYVDHQAWMYGDTEPFNAKLFIQSQFPESPCIEIHLYRVSRLLLEEIFLSEACGKLDDQKIFISFYHSSVENVMFNDFSLVAEEMKYRILDKSHLGEKLVF